MSDPLADPTRTKTAPEPPEAAPATVTGSTASQPQVPLGQDAGDTPRFAPPTHPGDQGRLGRYRVVKRLGVGGMGAVYLGEDGVLGRKVALKVMLPRFAANPQAKARFLREARTAAQVRSEHVVAILDVDEVGGTPFIAMEYLQGVPLDRYLSTHPGLNPAQVIRFGMEAARGLAAAHEKGLIHRDIKPANLFLEAPHGRVKVLDFGLAKEAEPGDDADVTRTGQVVGTPAYMSPEQARGATGIDHRTDLFSLGVVLYKLSTGRQPFRGPNPMAVVLAIGMDDPAPVRELNPAVPEALAALIHRLLAKQPADRPQTAADVHAALVAIEDADAVPEATAVDGEDDYAPIAVAVPESDAWGWGVDVPEAATDPSSPAPVAAEKPPARRAFPWLAAGGVLAAVLAIGLLAAVWDRINRKPAVAAKEPEPPPRVRPAVPPPAPGRADPDRWAADYLHPHGSLGLTTPAGRVQSYSLPSESPLPAEPFLVTGFGVNGSADREIVREVFFTVVPELKHLRGMSDWFHRMPLTAADLAVLATHPLRDTLESIVSNGTDLTPATIDELKKFPKLAHIGLRGVNVDDATLQKLARDLPGLTGLMLDGLGKSGNVTPAGLAALIGLPLKSLRLNSPARMTPEWWRELAKHPTLESLELNNTGFDDAMLAELAALPKLRKLSVGGTKVTDAGLARLHTATGLTNLNVRGTAVTLDGVLTFRAAVPKCGVESDFTGKAGAK